MNFRNYAVNFVNRYVPRAVAALIMDRRDFDDRNMSLLQKIDIRALEPTLFLDMNMVRGVELEIPLDDITPITISDNVLLYKIPSNLRNGRNIISALELSEKTFDRTGLGNPQLNNIQKTPIVAADYMAASMSEATPVSTAQLEKISHDEVIVYENINMVMGKSIRVLVSYSENFTEIHPAYYPKIAEIGLHAYKAYLYNEGVVRVAQSGLYNGQELSIIENIINEYSDSYQTYLEELNNTLPKQLFMTDERAMDRLMKHTFSIGY